MKYARIICLLVLTIFACPALSESSHIGIIIFVSGNATSTSATKITNTLQRRSKVYNGDTLITTKDSKIQIRFIDGAIVSLREDTVLKIDNYIYKPDEKKESSALSLIKGGFRTISGSIGKENYKVSTDMATIGIRGTHYEAAFEQGNLFVAAWNGGVKISNDGGIINLGLGAAYNFAQITHMEAAPAGLSNPPDVFKHQYNQQIPQAKKKPPIRQLAQSNKPEILATQLPPPPDISSGATISNQRNLSSINLQQRVGVIAYSGSGIPTFYGGKAGYDAAGNPVITDNGLGPHEAGFDSTAANVAFWKGTAATISKGSKDYGGGYVVDWGIWDVSGGGSTIRQDDPEGLAFESDVKRNLYWASLVQTPATTLSSLTGSASYSTSASMGNVIGGGSDGAINTSNFSFNADTNFDTGVVSGSMSISNADNWYVAFNGDPNNTANGKGLVNGVLDVSVDKTASLVSTTLGVKADMGIVITGANAEAIAGVFDLEAYNKTTNAAIPTIHAEGVFIAEQ